MQPPAQRLSRITYRPGRRTLPGIFLSPKNFPLLPEASSLSHCDPFRNRPFLARNFRSSVIVNFLVSVSTQVRRPHKAEIQTDNSDGSDFGAEFVEWQEWISGGLWQVPCPAFITEKVCTGDIFCSISYFCIDLLSNKIIVRGTGMQGTGSFFRFPMERISEVRKWL